MLKMMNFNINNIPEFSQKKRIVVVGVIGKSPYRYPNKTSPLLPSFKYEENGIECHWDERSGILYLHAVTDMDTSRLAALAADLDENSKSTVKDADAANWLVAAGELAAESCRVMALIFNLCHIVILSSPTPVFDIGYLQLFKAIDAFRIELLPRITAALSEAGVGGVWQSHGRLCCPRLLFHYRRAPRPLRKAPASLKRLEHSMEDQLYSMLRKARLITNVCAKSLFAIPKNEEFVYISADEEAGRARDVSVLVRGLVRGCAGLPGLPPAAPERPSLRQFLQGHVSLAQREGFDDNVGKYAMSTSFFELPSAASWRSAAQALVPLYQSQAEPLERDDRDPASALYDALATDVRFSQARCAKVLPIAQASYTEGLPAHYSRQHHAHKMVVSESVLQSMARGPLGAWAGGRLRAACAAVWRARSLCEAPSLTHHLCIEPEHDSSVEHSSGVRYVSACNCGRSKCARDDPYTVRQANCSFYATAAVACGHCDTLEAIAFPVFEPSTPTYKAANVKVASSQEAEAEVEKQAHASPASCSGEGVGAEAGAGAESGWSPDALSPGSRDNDARSSPGGYEVLPLRGDAAAERAISRQPSTTEYLPGMLHAASPPGLLPAFPSWSLLCLGSSSLYSHSLGLPEHMQPGFLPHTNYLLPWDCAVRSVEQVSAWRAAQAAARGRGKTVTVKIFIGFEYECPRGHRFMMSSPDTVMSGGGGGGGGGGGAGAGGAGAAGAGAGAGAGARLAASDMPVYCACVCRATALAQLTRVHVVTPKASVHVTLEPRVQPVPGGPVFTPQPAGAPPIALSPSAYWVLRLPFVYAAERGVLPRPARPPAGQPAAAHHPPAPAPAAGALLAPLFGLQD